MSASFSPSQGSSSARIGRDRAPNIATLVRATAADLFLDRIELRDALKRFRRDRRCVGGGEFVEPATHIRPAKGELDVALFSGSARYPA
jgi:hypothetical protein